MIKRLGVPTEIASDPDRIRQASHLILPGVGAFDAGASRLRELGLVGVLEEARDGGVPILGLCLGMQLLFESSAEGTEAGLGWIPGTIVPFDLAGRRPPLPVPHMGWNLVVERRPHEILASLEPISRFYFAHSFYAACAEDRDIVAETEYGIVFASVVARANVTGAQFHPEKSHRYGLQLFRNFLGQA